MTDWSQYWRENTPDMSRRVESIKALLKTNIPKHMEFIRLGSNSDGGYILANIFEDYDTKNSVSLVSMGVELNVDFEVHLSEYIKSAHLYDYSVDGTPVPVPKSTFFKEKIGTGVGEVTLGECLRRFADEDDDYILKMDIEGSEFTVLAAASTEELMRFNQITLEVHWMQNLWNDEFYNTALAAFTNLRETHTPVLVHANNNVPLMVLGNSPVPMVFEVLYLRTEDYEWPDQYGPFEGLITRNDPHFPEIGLTFP